MATYKIEKLIGRGQYSLIYQVRYNDSDNSEQIGEYKRIFFYNSEAVRCALREGHILRRIRESRPESPCLPLLLAEFTIDQSVIYITDAGYGNNLYNVMGEHSQLSIDAVNKYVLQLISALKALHALNIVHLNLKMENIIVSEKGNIKLTDFTHSYCKCFGDNYNWSKMNKSENNLYYMAPEVANEIEITPQSDVWQLGVVAATLATGNIRPFNDLSSLQEMAKRGYYNIVHFKRLPEYFQNFIDACLIKDHIKRPDVQQLENSSFIDGFSNNNLGDRFVLPIETSGIKGSGLKCINPCATDALNAAVERSFPQLLYSSENENEGFVKLLPYARQNPQEMKEELLSEDNISIVFGNYTSPSIDACENVRRRTRRRSRKY